MIDWISTSERLPENNDDVLIYIDYESGWCLIGFREGGKWHVNDGDLLELETNGTVTHWCVITPPKE